MNETELVKGCLKNNRESQKGLYEMFYSKMLGVCLRYSKNSEEAKEMINEGFLYVFNELKNYKTSENLENWVKNTLIIACISFLKKNRENMIVSTVYANKATQTAKTSSDISLEEIEYKANSELILKAIQELAPAYRKVYNLSVIEGFQHTKISEILNISEETSIQTLDKARFYLQQNIKQLILTNDAK